MESQRIVRWQGGSRAGGSEEGAHAPRGASWGGGEAGNP